MSTRRCAVLWLLALAAGCLRSPRYDRVEVVVAGEGAGTVVEGVVIDRRTGEPAREAEVHLVPRGGVGERVWLTGSAGTFRFTRLPGGPREFIVQVNYRDGTKMTGVELAPGRRVHLRFAVHPNPRGERTCPGYRD